MMHGATEHITVAFMNIGLMETAFAGRHAVRHLSAISRQVFELLRLHFVKVFCFVEVGQPREGLTEGSKTTFEDAVLLAGAAEHGHHNLTFLWADLNEAMVVVHTEDVRIVNGALLTHLYHPQPWRNVMQLYLHGPTPKDRVKILLSHQPSSSKHNLTMLCKETIIRNLVQRAGNEKLMLQRT